MPKRKLTDTACKQAHTGERLWDTEVKGFALFAGKTRKTFFFQRDINGKTSRLKIGLFGDGKGDTINAAQARTEALIIAGQYADGTAAKRAVAMSVSTLEGAMEGYLGRPKLRSEQNKRAVRRQMENHLGDWLSLPLDEITPDMCEEMHRTLPKRCSNKQRGSNGQVAANQTLQSFRSIYNYARKKNRDLPETPTAIIEWYDEKPPQKIIDDFEQWSKEVAAIDNMVHRAFYRFLLLTALRKVEALTLQWKDVFDDHLHLPNTKNGRPFDLPLLPEHHAILEPMKQFGGEYVFPADRSSPTSSTQSVFRGRPMRTVERSRRSLLPTQVCSKKRSDACLITPQLPSQASDMLLLTMRSCSGQCGT